MVHNLIIRIDVLRVLVVGIFHNLQCLVEVFPLEVGYVRYNVALPFFNVEVHLLNQVP